MFVMFFMKSDAKAFTITIQDITGRSSPRDIWLHQIFMVLMNIKARVLQGGKCEKGGIPFVADSK